MPVVPRGQLRVGMTSEPNARVSAPLAKDYSHEQSQQMGQSMQQFGADMGNIALNIQQEANKIRVQDAVNKATAEALDLTYGENGYKRLEGEGVMNRPDGKPMGVAYTEELQKRFTGIEDTLGNGAQRQAFQAWAGQYQGEFNAGLYKHEAEQALVYGKSVLRGTIGTQEQVIAHNWDKPEVVEASLERMSDAFTGLKQLEGVSGEELEVQRQAFTSKLHKHVLTQALQNGNPVYAQAYLEHYGSHMMAQDLQDAQKEVGGEIDMQVSSDFVNGLFAANPDADEQEMLGLAKQEPEIGEYPERMELVRNGVVAKKKALKEAKVQQREAALGQAQAALMENGGNWMALPLAVRSAVLPEIEPYVKAYAKSVVKPVQMSDAGAYLELNDVNALTSMSDVNFEMMRTMLSEDDFNFYAMQRAAYKEGLASGKGVKNVPGVLNMVEVGKQVDGVLKMLKIDANPRRADKYDKARVSAIRQVLNKQLLSSQMAEGKSYTKEEIASKVNEFVAEQVQQRTSINGIMRDIFTAQPSDMKLVVKQAIAYELMRQGVENPTEEQLFQKYLQKGRFDKQEQEGREIAAAFEQEMIGAFGGNPLITSASDGKEVNNPYFGTMVDGFTAYSGGGSTWFLSSNQNDSSAAKRDFSVSIPDSKVEDFYLPDIRDYESIEQYKREESKRNTDFKRRASEMLSSHDMSDSERELLLDSLVRIQMRGVEAMDYMGRTGVRSTGSGTLNAISNNFQSIDFDIFGETRPEKATYVRCSDQTAIVAAWVHDLKGSQNWEIYEAYNPGIHHWLEVVVPQYGVGVKIDSLHGTASLIDRLKEENDYYKRTLSNGYAENTDERFNSSQELRRGKVP